MLKQVRFPAWQYNGTVSDFMTPDFIRTAWNKAPNLPGSLVLSGGTMFLRTLAGLYDPVQPGDWLVDVGPGNIVILSGDDEPA